MIDDLGPARPQSGFNARVGRLAGAGRGRHPALHDGLPGERSRPTSARSAAPATTTSPGPPSGRRCTSTPAARRRRSQTLRAKGNGQLVYNADQFRWGGSFWRITDRFAPHNVYTDGKQLREPGQAARAPRTADGAGLAVRRPTRRWRSARRRPDRPVVLSARTRSTTTTTGRRNTLSPVGDRRGEADRRGDRQAGRTRRTWSSC